MNGDLRNISKEMLEAIVDSIPAGVVVIENANGKVTYVNEKAICLCGVDPRGLQLPEYSSKLMKLLTLSGDIYPSEQLPTNKALLTGKEAKDELIIERQNGSRIIVDASAKPIKDKKGQVIAAVGIFDDVTERKKAEEALRRSEVEFKTLAENAPDAIMRFDRNLRVLYLNPKDLEATGKRLEEFIGKTNDEMGMPAELCRLWNGMFHRARTSRKFQEVEFDFNTPAGIKTFNLRVVPEFLEDGSLVSYLGISRDITERKKVEEALKQSEHKLEEYNRNLEKIIEERTKKLKDSERLATIGATAGMVGHDIRNPLQAIIGDLYLAREEMKQMPKGEGRQSMEDTIGEIERNIDYINKIVKDLQDFVRPTTPTAQETDLQELCEGILFKNGLPDNIEGTCQVEKNARRQVTDPALLSRVLGNLITNSVQAMPDGGKLSVHAFKEQDDTVITVEDTGCGIPENLRQKLFTPLFTTKAKGQGFGLAVVKRLTEALGGTIMFESEIGKGTKFILRFPLRES